MSADESFTMEPGFPTMLAGLQELMSTGISTAYATVTPAQLSAFAFAMGPLGLVPYTTPFFEAVANNVASGLETAINHIELGVSSTAAEAGYLETDQAL